VIRIYCKLKNEMKPQLQCALSRSPRLNPCWLQCPNRLSSAILHEHKRNFVGEEIVVSLIEIGRSDARFAHGECFWLQRCNARAGPVAQALMGNGCGRLSSGDKTPAAVQLTRLGCRGVEEVGLVALLLYEIGAATSLYLGINANEWVARCHPNCQATGIHQG
jgi:hypothetical protein